MQSGARLGPYDLVRKIAAGGMAEIFLARTWGEEGFFHEVVIKRLFGHLAELPEQRRMFLDEARLMSQLAHPNIPQVYALGRDGGSFYLAMERVEGHTLADLWRFGARSGRGMPLGVALGIVGQACEALHHAHERKDRAGRPLTIVHRDVTPQNLMLTRDGVVKVMDFGVAHTAARKDTVPGAMRGTLSYMAPEQVRARPVDRRADLFSLGVILYELTTGTRLFRGTDVQIMTHIVERDPPRPSERVQGYPGDLEEIVMACLARERSKRLPTAAHLAAYLEDYALRHAIPVGPRSVAAHVHAVAPAAPVPEEELGLVEPPLERPRLEVILDSEAQRVWEPASGGEDEGEELPEIDEDELLGDLEILSVPPGEGPPGALELDPDVDLERSEDRAPRAQRPSRPLLRLDESGPNELRALRSLLDKDRPPRPSEPEGAPFDDDTDATADD